LTLFSDLCVGKQHINSGSFHIFCPWGDPVFSCSDSKGIHTPRLRKTETDFPCFPAAERSHCATVKTWSNHTNSQFVFISASATNQFCQPKHDPDFHDSRRHTSSLKQNCILLKWLISNFIVHTVSF